MYGVCACVCVLVACLLAGLLCLHVACIWAPSSTPSSAIIGPSARRPTCNCSSSCASAGTALPHQAATSQCCAAALEPPRHSPCPRPLPPSHGGSWPGSTPKWTAWSLCRKENSGAARVKPRTAPASTSSSGRERAAATAAVAPPDTDDPRGSARLGAGEPPPPPPPAAAAAAPPPPPPPPDPFEIAMRGRLSRLPLPYELLRSRGARPPAMATVKASDRMLRLGGGACRRACVRGTQAAPCVRTEGQAAAWPCSGAAAPPSADETRKARGCAPLGTAYRASAHP